LQACKTISDYGPKWEFDATKDVLIEGVD